MPRQAEDIDEEHRPYPEPDIEHDVWPEAWTPKQRENWIDHGAPVYERLETEAGRHWYRRCWRPKKQNEGMLKRDHVKLGTPEDYVTENVADTLQPMGNITSVMMRTISSYSVDREELDEAVSDIVQAKVRVMPEGRRQRLGEEARRLARAYGLELEEA